MSAASERKKRVSARLRKAGLVRVYVPGDSNQYMLVPKHLVPPAARRESDTEYRL